MEVKLTDSAVRNFSPPHACLSQQQYDRYCVVRTSQYYCPKSRLSAPPLVISGTCLCWCCGTVVFVSITSLCFSWASWQKNSSMFASCRRLVLVVLYASTNDEMGLFCVVWDAVRAIRPQAGFLKVCVSCLLSLHGVLSLVPGRSMVSRPFKACCLPPPKSENHPFFVARISATVHLIRNSQSPEVGWRPDAADRGVTTYGYRLKTSNNGCRLCTNALTSVRLSECIQSDPETDKETRIPIDRVWPSETNNIRASTRRCTGPDERNQSSKDSGSPSHVRRFCSY